MKPCCDLSSKEYYTHTIYYEKPLASQESRASETAYLSSNMFRVSQEIRLNTSSSAEVTRYCNTTNADSENDCIFGKYQRTPDAGEYICTYIWTNYKYKYVGWWRQMCVYIAYKFSFVWLKKLRLYKQINEYIMFFCFSVDIFIPFRLVICAIRN